MEAEGTVRATIHTERTSKQSNSRHLKRALLTLSWCRASTGEPRQARAPPNVRPFPSNQGLVECINNINSALGKQSFEQPRAPSNPPTKQVASGMRSLTKQASSTSLTKAQQPIIININHNNNATITIANDNNKSAPPGGQGANSDFYFDQRSTGHPSVKPSQTS